MKPADLADRVRDLHRAGVRDAEIAKRAEVSQSTIWRIRNDQSPRMLADTAERLTRSIGDLDTRRK